MTRKKLMSLPLEKLASGKFDVRSEVDDAKIDALAASIQRIGLVSPLVVRPESGSYVIVAGHRRFAACKRIGLKEITCFVDSSDESELREKSLAENIFRQDLSPVELAAAAADILAQKTMTVDELAAGMHRSVHWVADLVDICKWPECLQCAVHVGALSLAAARPLAQITDLQYLDYLVDYACQNGATARTTAAWVQAWQAAKPPSEAIQADPIPGRAESPAVIPCSPCLGCHENFRTDSVAHMPLCPDCLAFIRAAADSGAFKK